MRRTPILALCGALVVTACGPSVVDAPPSTTLPVASSTTTTIGTTGIWIDVEGLDALKQQTPPTIPTAREPGSPSNLSGLSGGIDVDYEGLARLQCEATAEEAAEGPGYVVSGDARVFRVVDRVASLVMDRSDVMWVGDDGKGGLLYHAADEPFVVKRWWAGATEPEVVLGRESHPWLSTFVDGRPTLVARRSSPECPDGDWYDMVFVDLLTAVARVYLPCLPLEMPEVRGPVSIGGDLAVSVEGEWEEGADGGPLVTSRLVFRRVEMPEAITSQRKWDDAAVRLLGSLELDVAANPWPEPCPWCELSPYLSPDGSKLAIAELIPQPSDYGVADWEEFGELDWAERVRLSSEFRQEVRLRTIDLTTGTVEYSETWPGNGGIVDFDGRYLIYQYVEGPLHSVHLIDSRTGGELPVCWAGNEPDPSHISLLLPSPISLDVTLRPDGVGPVSFGDPVEEAIGLLVGALGPPDQRSEGPGFLEGTDTLTSFIWTDEGLGVFFSDGPYFRDDGNPQFFHWFYNGTDFTTEDGLGIGSTIADLRAVYGTNLAAPEPEQCGAWRNELVTDNGLTFTFGTDPDSTNPETQVTGIYAGAAPACH